MAEIVWSIVVPVLNEGATLGRFLDRLFALSCMPSCEVLVVDGGSTDHTRDVLMAYMRTHPRLSVLDAPPGKGLALRRGFAKARGRAIVFLDGDLQYDPRDLPKLMACVERGADLAVSRRRLAWADNSVRRLASRTFVRLGHALLHLPVSDPQSGMKAFRAALLPRLHLTAPGWGLDVQLIRQANALGARIEEVEIEFHPRQAGQTKTGLVSTSFDLLRTALGERENLPPRAWPRGSRHPNPALSTSGPAHFPSSDAPASGKAAPEKRPRRAKSRRRRSRSRARRR